MSGTLHLNVAFTTFVWHIEAIDSRQPSRPTPLKDLMTHVVTDACIKCKYTDCVDVCPVDCFKEGPDFLVIDPDECIDCAVCIPECPVNAIYADTDTPAQFEPFFELNQRLARQWPTISRRIAPLATAEQWKDKTGKLASIQFDG